MQTRTEIYCTKHCMSLLIVLFFMTGCQSTPTTQVAAFSESASSVTEKIEAVFTEYNDVYITTQLSNLAFQFDGATNMRPDDMRAVNPSLTASRKKNHQLYKAIKGLQNYAKSLQALANAGSKLQIDTASANFYGAVIDINTQYQTLKNTATELVDQKDLSTISALIASIGHAISEKKKRNALKSIILRADPMVNQIIDEMVRQLDDANLHDAVVQNKLALLDDETLDYNVQARKGLTRVQRMVLLRAMWEKILEIDNAQLITKKSKAALQAIKKAHNVLAKEVGKDVFSSAFISKAIGQLKSIEKTYDDFRSLLRECESDEFEVKDGKLICKIA